MYLTAFSFRCKLHTVSEPVCWESVLCENLKIRREVQWSRTIYAFSLETMNDIAPSDEVPKRAFQRAYFIPGPPASIHVALAAVDKLETREMIAVCIDEESFCMA